MVEEPRKNPGIESLVTQRIRDYKSVAGELAEDLRQEVRNSHRESISMMAIYCGENPDSYIESYELGIKEVKSTPSYGEGVCMDVVNRLNQKKGGTN